MASYSVEFKRSALKELAALPSKKDRQRLVAQIRSLADDPRPPGSEKLTDQERYRLRQGRYRILYEIDGGRCVVIVVKIADRKDVYRRK